MAGQQALAVEDINPFIQAFRGSFLGVLRWEQLDTLWNTLRNCAGEDWYIYAVGEAAPDQPTEAEAVLKFIEEIDALLRQEHDESYCGIVYADDFKQPSFIKIFDPNNLGVSCGYSDNPPLPGWVMSKLPPVDLKAMQQPAGRRRWWQRLFS